MKSVNSILPWALHQHLPPGSCPFLWWWTVSAVEMLLWLLCFTTAIVILTKRANRQIYLRDHWRMLVIASLFLPQSQTKLSAHQSVDPWCLNAKRQPISVKWDFSFFFSDANCKESSERSTLSPNNPPVSPGTLNTYYLQTKKGRKESYVWVYEYRCS